MRVPIIGTKDELPESVVKRVVSKLSEKYPTQSPEDTLASLPKKERDAWLSSLSNEELKVLEYEWKFHARPKQRFNEYGEIQGIPDWEILLYLAGRGSGKTRASAEWVRESIESGVYRHIALIGPTASDVRKVMVEDLYSAGSGIMQICPPWNRPKYSPTTKRLVWDNPNYKSNGAICSLYSADEPDLLRGPQHDAAWVDELMRVREQEEVWYNLRMGLRLGSKPRVVISTTPRPTALMMKLMKMEKTLLIRGSTFENISNLSSDFVKAVLEEYEGTRIGRQELYAEVLSDIEGALWNSKLLESAYMNPKEGLPLFSQTVIGVDPQVSSDPEEMERKRQRGFLTGIVVASLAPARHGKPATAYVRADRSMSGSPREWAEAVVRAYHDFNANIIIAERNQGGELIMNNIHNVDRSVRVKLVTATKSKGERAIPVVSRYEQNRVRHVGSFPELTAEMCLSGDTRVVTPTGPVRIDQLVGRELIALGGDGDWHPATGHSFGEQEVFKVRVMRTKHVQTIYATADHRWFEWRSRDTKKDKFDPRKVVETRTHELLPGAVLVGRTRKNILEKTHLDPIGVMAGFVYGDGWDHSENTSSVAFYPQDEAVMKWFGPHVQDLARSGTSIDGGTFKKLYGLPRFLNRDPDFTESSSFLYGWLAGYFAADGSIAESGQTAIVSTDKFRVEAARHVCLLLGIKTGPIVTIRPTRTDGNVIRHKVTGEVVHKIRNQAEVHYCLNIYPGSLQEEFFIHERHRERWVKRAAGGFKPSYLNWRVLSVEPAGVQPVYCLNVPTDGRFVLADTNIISGNCTFVPGDEHKKKSPNRVDALVYTIDHLLVSGIRAGAGLAITRRI